MRDDEGGHARFGEVLDDLQHLLDHLRVEGAGRLVKEHHVRLHRKRADDGKTLLLSAGEPGGILIGLVGKADPGKKLHRLRLGLLLRNLFLQRRRQRDIVHAGQVRKHVEMLEHHADALTVFCDIRLFIEQLRPLKQDGALVRLLKAVQAAQERALAAAAGADDGDRLSFIEGHIDPPKDGQVSERFPKVRHLDQFVSLSISHIFDPLLIYFRASSSPAPAVRSTSASAGRAASELFVSCPTVRSTSASSPAGRAVSSGRMSAQGRSCPRPSETEWQGRSPTALSCRLLSAPVQRRRRPWMFP